MKLLPFHLKFRFHIRLINRDNNILKVDSFTLTEINDINNILIVEKKNNNLNNFLENFKNRFLENDDLEYNINKNCIII